MTVITYSDGAGRLLYKIQVPEHPSAYRNVPQPLFEILEPGTMLDPVEIQEGSGVRSPRLIEEKEGRKAGNIKKELQTLRTLNSRRKDLRKYRKGCGKNTAKGKDKNKTHVSGMLSLRENNGEISQREKRSRKKKLWLLIMWLLPLKIISEEKMKMQMKIIGLRWHHVFFWLPLLFLSLCPKLASSQVRVLISKLWRSQCNL